MKKKVETNIFYLLKHLRQNLLSSSRIRSAGCLVYSSKIGLHNFPGKWIKTSIDQEELILLKLFFGPCKYLGQPKTDLR